MYSFKCTWNSRLIRRSHRNTHNARNICLSQTAKWNKTPINHRRDDGNPKWLRKRLHLVRLRIISCEFVGSEYTIDVGHTESSLVIRTIANVNSDQSKRQKKKNDKKRIKTHIAVVQLLFSVVWCKWTFDVEWGIRDGLETPLQWNEGNHLNASLHRGLKRAVRH